MVLELSPQQIHVLHASLAESIDGLRNEIARTDEYDLREHLKEKLDELQALQRQVGALMHQEQVAL
jgi:uncharacterized protein YdeI (YjbR/CyaY-like superfamily)